MTESKSDATSSTSNPQTHPDLDGYTRPMVGSLLFQMFGAARKQVLRNMVLKVVMKSEHGEFRSLTARRIMKEFYGRHVSMHCGAACFVPEAFSFGPPDVWIGRYTSPARTMRWFNGNHPVDWKSTHAYFYEPRFGFTKENHIEKVGLTIGSDVWIGHNAILMPTVREIGHGAVIAAGAVVSRPVPPYAIVAGYPARVTGYRFKEETIEKLLAEQWWEKSVSEIKERMPEFQHPLERGNES